MNYTNSRNWRDSRTWSCFDNLITCLTIAKRKNNKTITMMWQFTLTGVLLVGNTPLVELTFITTENNEIWESGKSSLGLLLMSCASASIPNIALNIKFLKTYESFVLRRKQKSTTQWDHLSRLSCKSHASWSTSHFNYYQVFKNMTPWKNNGKWWKWSE